MPVNPKESRGQRLSKKTEYKRKKSGRVKTGPPKDKRLRANKY